MAKIFFNTNFSKIFAISSIVYESDEVLQDVFFKLCKIFQFVNRA